jgi:hypothetical protein
VNVSPHGLGGRCREAALLAGARARAPEAVGLLVLFAGLYGFRLHPDSFTYAGGSIVPSPLGGLIGRVGGMPLLIAASSVAAALLVAWLPSDRSRLVFVGLGGFWLLFPGVDALGVVFVALALRSRRWWFATLPVHLVAGLVTFPLLWRSRRPVLWAVAIALAVVVVFAFRDRSGAPVWLHVVFMTRYLLPALYLAVAR